MDSELLGSLSIDWMRKQRRTQIKCSGPQNECSEPAAHLCDNKGVTEVMRKCLFSHPLTQR